MQQKNTHQYKHCVYLLGFILLLIVSGLNRPLAKAADLRYLAGCHYQDNDILPIIRDVLSEEEARRIMKDEAAKGGIIFDIEEINIEPPEYLGSGRIFPYYPSSLEPNDKIFSIDYELTPLIEPSVFPEYELRISHKFDVTDRKHHIVCDYISELDTIVYYRTSKKTAQALVMELRSQTTNYWYGIFSSCGEDTLRFQVRCFIAWLRINGSPLQAKTYKISSHK